MADYLDVQLVSLSSGHIDVWIANWLNEGGYFFTKFYGHWCVSQRKHSWELLKRISCNKQLPSIVIGDFNELLLMEETDSSRRRAENQVKRFREVVDNLKLKELFIKNGRFTWWDGRSGLASAREKLDRALCNLAFQQLQPNYVVSLILTSTSDYHFLQLWVN